MKALDAVMSLLPRRNAGRHEVARYTFSDYASWVAQSMSFGGHQYNLTGVPGMATTYGKNPTEPIANNFEGYATGLLFSDGPVASAEAYRLRVFGQAPLLYQKRVDGRPGDLYDDASLDLMRKPWLGGTCGDLMKRTLLHGDVGGNSYTVAIDGELVLLRPDWVQIILTKRMYEGYQVGWKQVGIAYYEGGLGMTSDPAVFLPGEYIHFVPGLPDPLATYRGMSWLTPVIREIQADKSASEHKLKFFENAATPNIAVSLPKELTPSQFNEFVDQMESRHKGVANAYKTLYTGGGADVTVIGANMQQIDFGSVQGKGETRIANAAGVPPTLLSFSEGMQGSSLNAGNYAPTKRNFVDTTIRDLWQNWCGSSETLFPAPTDGDRLWYDPRDIPFLREDETDAAQIKQIEAATMNTLVTAGWEKASIIAAVTAGDWTLLKDTGLVSVQLLPPGTTATPADDAAPKAPARAQVVRKFNPDQSRIPAGHEGGGRWGTMTGILEDLASAVMSFDEFNAQYGDPIDQRDVDNFSVFYFDNGDMALTTSLAEAGDEHLAVLYDGDSPRMRALADELKWASLMGANVPDDAEADEDNGLVEWSDDNGLIVGYDVAGDVRVSFAANEEEADDFDMSPEGAEQLADALNDFADANDERQDEDEEERSATQSRRPVRRARSRKRARRMPKRVPRSRYSKKRQGGDQ